jgi:hypothetical protein
MFVQTFVSSVLAIFKSVFTTVTCNDIKILKYKLGVYVCLLLFVFLVLQPIVVVFTQPGSGL